MAHIRITSSCFGYGRSFDESPNPIEVTETQAEELIGAGRAVRVAPPSVSASREAAAARPETEQAAKPISRANRFRA